MVVPYSFFLLSGRDRTSKFCLLSARFPASAVNASANANPQRVPATHPLSTATDGIAIQQAKPRGGKKKSQQPPTETVEPSATAVEAPATTVEAPVNTVEPPADAVVEQDTEESLKEKIKELQRKQQLLRQKQRAWSNAPKVEAINLRQEFEQASAPPAADQPEAAKPEAAKKPEATKKPEAKKLEAAKPNLNAHQSVDKDGFISTKTKQQVKTAQEQRKRLSDSKQQARLVMAQALVAKKFPEKLQKGRPSSYADSTVTPATIQAHLRHCLNAMLIHFNIDTDWSINIDGCSWNALAMWDDIGFRATLTNAIKKLVPEAWISYGKQTGTIFISKNRAKATAEEAAPAPP